MAACVIVTRRECFGVLVDSVSEVMLLILLDLKKVLNEEGMAHASAIGEMHR